MGSSFFHSVTLERDKCKGCINCIKRCPTEAIRVRNGKAQILAERCIDCGECIRVCPHHAKQPIYDPLSAIDSFKYKVALPAPALFGQFHNLDDLNIVLKALLSLGFDDVFEVSKAAELVSDATRSFMQKNPQRPVISSACPAVVRLIRVRFPNLLEYLLPLNAPIEVAARMARAEAVKKTGLSPDQIGIVFISPCAAKVTAVKMPLGNEKSEVDCVIAIKEIYPRLLPLMKLAANDPGEMTETGRIGLSWGGSGGEASGTLTEQYLAADGIENVIKVLEDLEDEKFPELEFIELNACTGGCVGGVLTVENPYVAKTRLKNLRKYLPVARNHLGEEIPEEFQWDQEIQYEPVLKIADGVSEAITKMAILDNIDKTLPGLDCGSCGAPSCRALAEDVVRGVAQVDDCIFRLREQMHALVKGLSQLEGSFPAPFRTEQEEEE